MRAALWSALSVELLLGGCERRSVVTSEVSPTVSPPSHEPTPPWKGWPPPPPEGHSNEMIRDLVSRIRLASAQGFSAVDEESLQKHGWWQSVAPTLDPYLPGIRHGIVRSVPERPADDVLVHQFPRHERDVTTWETCAFLLLRVPAVSNVKPVEAMVRSVASTTILQMSPSGELLPAFIAIPSGRATEFSTAPSLPITSATTARSRIDAWVANGSVYFLVLKATAPVKFPGCPPGQLLQQ